MLTADAVLVAEQDEYRMYIRGQKLDERGEARCYIGLFISVAHATRGATADESAPPPPQLWGEQLTPRIGGWGAICRVDAASFDGTTWQEYAGNPVQAPGPLGSIDDMGPFAGEIIKVGGTYLHYYTAVQRIAGPDGREIDRVKRIGLATSRDGLSFQRHGSEAVLPAYTGAAVVVEQGGLYHSFFNRRHARGHVELCVVRSRDPYRFDVGAAQVALPPGLPGSWEGHQVQNPRVFRDQGLWYMVYGGSDRFDDNPHHFGVAASEDLRHWERYEGNPILARGEEGEWDDCAIWPCAVAHVGDTYYLYYEGRSSGEPQAAADARSSGRGRGGFSQVGLATMRSDAFFLRS